MLTKIAKKLLRKYPGPTEQYYNIMPLNTLSNCLIKYTDWTGIDRWLNASLGWTGLDYSLITESLIPARASYSGPLYTGFAVGSGDTPPTEDDLTLENQIISIVSPSDTIIVDNGEDGAGRYLVTCDLSIGNAADEDIIIREAGWFQSFKMAKNGQKGGTTDSTYLEAYTACVMVDRIVLDSPVTIPMGEVGIVRYKFIFDFSGDAPT